VGYHKVPFQYHCVTVISYLYCPQRQLVGGGLILRFLWGRRPATQVMVLFSGGHHHLSFLQVLPLSFLNNIFRPYLRKTNLLNYLSLSLGLLFQNCYLQVTFSYFFSILFYSLLTHLWIGMLLQVLVTGSMVRLSIVLLG
jgi:hypothetical protein